MDPTEDDGDEVPPEPVEPWHAPEERQAFMRRWVQVWQRVQAHGYLTDTDADELRRIWREWRGRELNLIDLDGTDSESLARRLINNARGTPPTAQ